MKFVCRNCEAFMKFAEVEPVGADALGVTFACPSCAARVAMVTNAGETQMVRALGVQLGGRKEAPQPLELTRKTLASRPEAGRVAADQEVRSGRDLAASPAAYASRPATEAAKGAEAPKEGGKCPFAGMIADMQPGAAEGAPQGAEVAWTPEALERLRRVPEFVRPFAKTMLEKLARDSGANRVDGPLLDSAKAQFMPGA